MMYRHALMTAALGSILGWVACAPAFVQENERLARQFLEEHPDAARVILPSAERRRPLGYVASGNPEKPKVVFIHGSPGSWKAFARYLDDAELRSRAYLIAVDRPGYGESGAGDPERSVLRQAELIRQVFEIGDPRQPVILLGHSYGGPVAAQLAMTDDDRIRRLIVVAGSVDPTLEKTKWIQYPADWWLFRWLVPTDLDVCNQEILALKPELVRMLPDWSKIRASVHVIHGEQDDLVPVANAAFIESRTTHVATRTQRIADLNHFVPWLRYDLLHDAVIAALDALDALPDSPHSP